MVIYVWPDGQWCYDFMWEECFPPEDARMINLDRLYDYKDLTPLQVKAIEDALSD